jgi:hypothetical protein
MAGNKGGRRFAGWFAASRKVVLFAVGIVSLLVLGTAAALIVDAVEITGPQISSRSPCDQSHQNVFLSGLASGPATCQWGKALSHSFSRTLLVKVNETESSAFRATATITTVAADPLVTMVQSGDGQDANTFSENVIGFVAAGDNTFIWSAPTVAMNSAGTTAVISTTGQPSDQPPIPRTVQLRAAAYSLPGTVELNTHNRVIAAVSEVDDAQGKVASESAHSLTVVNLKGELRISLQPGSPQPFSSSRPAGAQWLARTASTAWGFLRGFAGMLVPAGAWIAMLLASRMGAFGSVGQGPAWRRMERILGAVVIAHMVISACLQLTITDGNITNLLLNESSQGRLSRAMKDAGLWYPNQFAAVDGGVVLLIAFALVAAAWDPRGRKRPQSRPVTTRPSGRTATVRTAPSPRPSSTSPGPGAAGSDTSTRPPSLLRRISVLIALVIGAIGVAAAAVASYAVLAYANLIPRYAAGPRGSVESIARRPLLGVEIPVVTLFALLVMLLAAAWICGTLASRQASAGGSLGRAAARFPRIRGVMGGAALVAAVALIGVGIAARIAYDRHPLSVDADTLSAAGSLTVLTVLVIVVVSLIAAMSPVPGVEPGPPATSARTLIVFGGGLVAVALVIGLPFYLVPYLVSQEFTDGSTGHFSGTAVLAACLVMAAVLAFAAGVASRPWRAGGSVNRWYWVVPLVAVLAVAAPLTEAGGYVPVALRWGVLIITGAFLGMAVVRLTATAVGPLRSRESRTPHVLAAVLITAVIAVPWGELGHSFQIGWWDLLTYANRIDGVLPLILVAAGVITLRRLGLVPRQDETTLNADRRIGMLNAHRRIGIAAWVVALSGSYAFGGSADLAATGALAAAAIAAWLLMPRGQVSHASVILGQTEQETSAAVQRVVETGVARRTFPGLAKTMRDEVAAGKTDFAKAQGKLTELEERASATSTVAVAGPRRGLRVADDERAFGTFISRRPWKRAQWGVGYAVIAGAPWVLLGLAGASVSLGGPEGYPELALISAVAPLVLRWAGYGLLFGYFFPLLRGRTGLSKSISFFAAAVAPSVLSTLASPHAAGQQWHSAALLAIQLLIFALTMGLLADLAVLRKHGFNADRLVDVHSLWTISAWASSFAIAIGTGIATILLAGLQPFVIGVITPSPPSTPPAATSTHR